MKNCTTAGKTLLLALVLVFFTGFSLNAQNNYWQQKVDTRIEVVLDDAHHFLHGNMQMVYTNHSPDTLRFIYMHLYPNAYKNDRTAFDTQAVENGITQFYFSKEEQRGYIDSLMFTVNGQNAVFELQKNIDEAKLMLPKPLLPEDSIVIATPFRVKIPLVFSRMGHDGQAYQISQWYPKPAVYDRRGWHSFPYLDQGEFYSEYGTYDVFITLPENYILMATGNMVDAPKEQQWLDSLAALPLPPDTLYKSSFPTSSQTLKTIHFHEDKVHDFAWFADKRWIVRKDTLKLPGNDHPVIAYRCFLPLHSKGWKNSRKAMKTAMEGYSKEVGPYPYRTVKVVDGALSENAGGMEYPTIAVIASANAPGMIDEDIIHEVGHNWFYGLLGSNERDFPWMDEGINSFYEQRLSQAVTKIRSKSVNFWTYALLGGIRELQPADTVSTAYTALNYGADIYAKVPLLLHWLEVYMGKERFGEAMQAYYREFRYKHPQPEDFKRVFQRHTEKDIDWFFEVLGSGRPVDFALNAIHQNADSIRIKLNNKTGLKSPALVMLRGINEGNDTMVISKWTKPFQYKTILSFANPDKTMHWKRAWIGDAVPDFNAQNNSNKKTISLRPFLGLNSDSRHKAWVMPAVGYNYYDGFMVGLAFHNLTIPQNRLQFGLAPLYATGSNQFEGTGFLSYTWFFHQGWLHDLSLNLRGKSFAYDKSDLNLNHYVFSGYQKLSPELVLNIRKPFPRSPVERKLTLKGYWIREGALAYHQNAADSLYYPEKGESKTHLYALARYEFENKRTFNPFGYTFEGQIGKSFAKLSVSGHLRINYYLKNKGLNLRGYFGKMFVMSENPLDANRYLLTAAFSGWNDYLYDETFIARNRNTGFLANQIAMKEGGFKMNTLQYAQPLGLSENWLASLNITTDLPFGKIPLQVFGDLAAFPKIEEGNETIGFLYEAGVSLHFGKILTFYMPLVLSKDLNDYSKSILGENRILKSVSFELNLNRIDWTKLSRMVLKLI